MAKVGAQRQHMPINLIAVRTTARQCLCSKTVAQIMETGFARTGTSDASLRTQCLKSYQDGVAMKRQPALQGNKQMIVVSREFAPYRQISLKYR